VIRQLLIPIALLAATLAYAQPDYAREKRWADEIAPGLVVGDAVYLTQASGHKFLALYTQAAKPRGAVIIVHGLGVHPDWALIGTLRRELAEQGYTTLSVQMPVLAATAKGDEYGPLYPDAAERLRAALAFLEGKGARRIGLVSHSLGARMSNYFLTQATDKRVATWVSIGILGEYADAARLAMPVLDIYGERDFALVLEKADARAAALAKIKGSAQVQVGGADHFFVGHEAELVKQVRQFLDRRLN
jgi:dienelactone hydrolase